MTCPELAGLSRGRQDPTVLQVVKGKIPEVGGEVRQDQEPPGQRVPEETGAGAVRVQAVLDDLPEAPVMLPAPRQRARQLGRGSWAWGGLTSSVVCTILSTEEK